MGSDPDYLQAVVQAQKQGRAQGLYSICSANRFVLEAALLQAHADHSAVCIESTSNQVNQFGGYIGMTPRQFAAFVYDLADSLNFPRERIILGGDHLAAHQAIEDCVLSGYTKIHLDASMRLGGDPGAPQAPLSDETVTARAAELCAAAEAAHARMPRGTPAPRYVIGTEVPIPGGEKEAQAGPQVTRAADAARTIELGRAAFKARGLEAAWERVVALVVQPGVEFGDANVFEYQREKAGALVELSTRPGGLLYEAHSTDYQTRARLKEMVEDHFAILKVGPWLTFAFREAVFALAAMEEELLAGAAGVAPSGVRETLEQVLLADPRYWKPYYHGDEAALRYARKYSFSDRCRYYWPQPRVAAALDRLLANLAAHRAPLTLLSQFLPVQYEAVRSGEIRNQPAALIHHKIRAVTGVYACACRTELKAEKW